MGRVQHDEDRGAVDGRDPITEPTKLIAHWEKGPKFDVMKTRPGYFRASDHQFMHEMYTVDALPANEIKNQWDIFKSSAPAPGPDEDLEVIATTKEVAECKMG